MKTETLRPQYLTLDGKRYVLLPESQYRRLAAQPDEPALPEGDAQGNYPALEAMRAMLARDIIRDRQRLGLSQADLARRAGIRIETLCRIETGKHAPSVPTVEKIDRALKAAEPRRGMRRGKSGAS